jgi:probable phosphoglycerate mutase
MPHPGLKDLDVGDWTGLGVDAVAERWPHEALLWKTAPHALRIPGGESLQDLAARTADALAAMLHAHQSGTIAVVTHESVIRTLLCHALEIALSGYRRFAPSPCGISMLDWADARFTVESVNETQHLSGI